jgi:PAS domain S-box-containing protein
MGDAGTSFDPLSFLAGGGELGDMLRARDWTSSPLGPPVGWPQPLKTLVGVMLNSNQPMFIAWGEQRTMLYNDCYAPLLGLRHPAALGARFGDVWHDIMPVVGPILDKALAGEATHMPDLALVTERNGFWEEAHFAFSYTPVRDESGAVAGMFCACSETTRTVQAERRRLGESEQLQRLFARAPGFMAVVRGPEHVFEMANASFLQLVGRHSITGMSVREALPEVAGQGFISLLDELYRTGDPFTGKGVEILLRPSPDEPAQPRLLDFVYQPIVEADGSVSGIFVEGYDVTERIEAERALRESEERFRLIANSAPVPMWVTRLDRSRGFVNQAYADFLGVSYDEALNFDWRTVVHPEDGERLVRESLAGEASLRPFRLEARYRRSDGEWRWLRSESQPRWDSQGEHVGFIGVAHDITESKQGEAALRQLNETLERRVAERTADLRSALEQLQTEMAERVRVEDALRQAQKMEAVGQLTGGIAHDFNNLLTPIVGGLQFVASRVDDPRTKRIAEAALESAQRGAKLTGQLLAFSRVQRISMAPVDVNKVITNLTELLRHAVGDRIAVEFALDEHAGHARCDANQLENALLNLAINARDAIEDGGTLTLTSELNHIEGASDVVPGDYVRISVSDTGQGMPPEVAARATEPFFSTKEVGKGTGLGLAQVYGIAQQAGGTLRIESAVGRGTTVHILLPAAEPLAAAEPEGAVEWEPAAERRSAAILVIDDDAAVREFLFDALDSLGYRVTLAEDGAQGLARLAERVPDLVLIDYAMPGMHGAEVAERIRATHPDLPLIFVTGYAQTERIEAALGRNAAVLKKPFDARQLDAAIRAQISLRVKSAPLEALSTSPR